MSDQRNLSEIQDDARLTNAGRAVEAYGVHSGGSDGDALYGAAVAQMYALLAVADQVGALVITLQDIRTELEGGPR